MVQPHPATWRSTQPAAVAFLLTLVVGIAGVALPGSARPGTTGSAGEFDFTPPPGWNVVDEGLRDGVPYRRYRLGTLEAGNRGEVTVTCGSTSGVACSADMGPCEIADMFMSSFEKRAASWPTFVESEGVTLPATWHPAGAVVEAPVRFAEPARTAAARTTVVTPETTRISLIQWVAFGDEGPIFEVEFRGDEPFFQANLHAVLAATATLAPSTPGGAK